MFVVFFCLVSPPARLWLRPQEKEPAVIQEPEARGGVGTLFCLWRLLRGSTSWHLVNHHSTGGNVVHYMPTTAAPTAASTSTSHTCKN